MVRSRPALAVVVLLATAGVCAPSSRPPDLVSGIQHVKEGDLEAAVATLEAVAKALAGDPLRAPERARAHLYLGVAHVGLGHLDEARARFRQALELDPGVRLARSEFSPKVLAVWDATRREVAAARPRSGAPVVPMVAAAAGVTAAGVVLLSGGGEEPGGSVAFSDARFATPTVVCPNGSIQAPIKLSLLVTARNTRADSVPVTQVTATLRIVASSSPDEVGLVSREAAQSVPAVLSPSSTLTLRVDTTLVCHNVAGNPERWNDWKAEVTLVSSAATATLTTVDQLRIENP